MSVSVILHGVPEPSEEWMAVDGTILQSTDRIQIERSGSKSTFTIQDVKRTDTQEYTVTAKNPLGIKSASFYVTVFGRHTNILNDILIVIFQR